VACLKTPNPWSHSSRPDIRTSGKFCRNGFPVPLPLGRHGLVKSTSPVHVGRESGAGQESGIRQRPWDVVFRTSVEASSTADFMPRVARREISIILLPVSIQVWRTSTKMRL
jgi:hypothetical protein